MTCGPTCQLGASSGLLLIRMVLGQGPIVLPPCWLKMFGSDYLNDLVEGG
jgi:hypothetical protein